MNLNIQSPQDINYLKQLLASGAITEGDLANMSISGSSNPQNALAQIVNPPVQPTRNVYSDAQNPGPTSGPQFDPSAPTDALRSQGAQFIRNESTGQTQFLAPQPSTPTPPQQKLGDPVEVVGMGMGRYSADGRSVVFPDGRVKDLFPKASAEAAKLAFEQQKQQADLAATQASTANTIERTRASKVNTPDFGAPAVQAAVNGTTGDQFLQTLDKPMADQVKALAEGRMAFPAGFALKSPYWQNMIRMVSQYDPNFDAINYNNRSSTRKDFTSGKSAQSLNALNTVMGHLDDLERASAALNNTGFPAWNTIANAVGSQIDPKLKGKINAFNVARQAVSSELERAYRGTGGNMAEIEAWKKSIDAADSPQALQDTVRQAVTLLNSKIGALADTYNKGMGTTAQPFELLSPKAKATYLRLSGEGQPEASQGDPLVVVAPDGSRHRFPTPQAAAAFKKAIGQ